MNLYKNYRLSFMVLVLLACLSACLDEQEEEFDVVGGVGTISVFNVSDASPSQGETITMDLTFFSEREPVSALVLRASIDGEAPVLIENREISNFNTADSQVETFTYQVPAEANGRRVQLEAEIITANELSNTRTEEIQVLEDEPVVRIISLENDLPFGDIIEGEQVTYELGINENTAVLYRDLAEVRSYYSIDGGAEVAADTIFLPGRRDTTEFAVTIPPNSEGEDVVFRFEVESTKAGIAEVTATAETVVSPTPLNTNVAGTISANETDTIAYDMVNFTNVPTAGPAPAKDLRITAFEGNIISLEADNGTGFVESSSSLFNEANLNTIILAYENGEPTSQIEITQVGDVFVAKLRDSEEYTIFEVTDLTITETSAEVLFEVKGL